MKLVHADYDLRIDFKENEVPVLVIENRECMQQIVQELYDQIAGRDGGFVLSEGEKILDMGKTAMFIRDFFSLDCNDRKILNKVYQELEEIALEIFPKEQMELASNIYGYLENICDAVPYHITYQENITPSGLLKLAEAHLGTVAETLPEKIVEYMGLVSKVCKIKLFIFFNLKSAISDRQLNEIYKYAFYNKINIWLIENVEYSGLLEEKKVIFDQDRCIIEP